MIVDNFLKVFWDDFLGIFGLLFGWFEGFEDGLMDFLWGEVVVFSLEFFKVGKELEEIWFCIFWLECLVVVVFGWVVCVYECWGFVNKWWGGWSFVCGW